MKKLFFVSLCAAFLCLILSGCGDFYSVDYSGQMSCYSNAKQTYKEGSKVTLYYDIIATDTDYSFYLDGADLDVGYSEDKGYILTFVMPDHDVTLRCESRNTMEYDGYLSE